MKITMNRRSFLAAGTLAVAGGLSQQGNAAEPVSAKKKKENKPLQLVTSAPVLQIPSDKSIGISWAVNTTATGYVEISEKKDFSNPIRFSCCCAQTGLNALDDRVLAARVTGLNPNTVYYYRTGTVPVDAPHCYRTKVAGKTELGAIRSFRTMGKDAPSAFSVINDTHENKETFRALSAKLAELNAPVTVWNGDIWNTCEKRETAVENLLTAFGTEYAADRPVLYTPGNHDYRGRWCRNLGQVFLTRSPEERESKFWSLGRNFAVRQGQIAMIGLDTGEDKPDANPVWAGLANFESYRRLQTQWLESALTRPEIASAPYLVAFCHIPLFDKRPNANPGDIMVNFAAWQRPCSQMWSPLFKKYGVQLLVCAHMHAYRFDPPSQDRPWAQIVGGGPQMTQGSAVTVIHGDVRNDALVVDAHDLVTKSILGTHMFRPRV